jgi:hypothetical protein
MAAREHLKSLLGDWPSGRWKARLLGSESMGESRGTMKRPFWILVVLSLAGSAAADGSVKYQCGKHEDVFSVSLTSGQPSRIRYNNEDGVDAEGNHYGCGFESVRGGRDTSWVTNGTKTTITFDLGHPADAAQAIIDVQKSDITLTFAGRRMYFCGAAAILPDKVVLHKKSGECESFGGE